MKVINQDYVTSAMGISEDITNANREKSDRMGHLCIALMLPSDTNKDVFGRRNKKMFIKINEVESNFEINIMSNEEKRIFSNRAKSIHPEDILVQFNLLDDITKTLNNIGQDAVEVTFYCSKYQYELKTKLDDAEEKSLVINILPEEVRRKFIIRSKSIHLKINQLLHIDYSTFYSFHFTSYWVSMIMYHTMISLGLLKLLVDITTTSEKTGEEPTEVKKVAAEKRSKQESTKIKLYRNVIRNETSRMMTGIDMVVSEANHLFGLERSWIFFDLLDDGLLHFGSAGDVPDFVPDMAESIVRQHVISFFEHSHNTINQLMTLLLGCPDRKGFQQMSEKNLISLMQSVMDNTLKIKTKGGKKLSSEESTFNMVDSKEFERALGEDIPGKVLDRLKHGDEAITMLVDTRLEGTQASERRKNRLIHYIYFPKDCRLYIYIPTEKGSYWHEMDMQRASRICQNCK